MNWFSRIHVNFFYFFLRFKNRNFAYNFVIRFHIRLKNFTNNQTNGYSEFFSPKKRKKIQQIHTGKFNKFIWNKKGYLKNVFKEFFLPIC